jgi:hypothetical protein
LKEGREEKNMKKIGLISLALVLAMGALGTGYAMWSDTITITGTVNTADVCLEFNADQTSEVLPQSCLDVGKIADFNYTSWVENDIFTTSYSCPPGYHFEGVIAAPECKNVGLVTIEEVDEDKDNHIEELKITIDHAYPYYLAVITIHVHNCGTIPLIVQKPILSQDEPLMIEWLNNVGDQIHPCQTFEMSFRVGVPQSAAQNASYTFSISLTGVQWNEG